MGALVRTGPLTHDGPESRSDHRPGLAVAAFATAIGAWAGVAGLVSGFLDLGPELDNRLPFGSPVFGAAALTTVVAVPFSLLGSLAWHANRRSGMVAAVDGVLLMGWILIELACIRSLSVLQPTYFVAGLGFLLVGRRDLARRSHGARAS
jgi:hypothetical protein